MGAVPAWPRSPLVDVGMFLNIQIEIVALKAVGLPDSETGTLRQAGFSASHGVGLPAQVPV